MKTLRACLALLILWMFCGTLLQAQDTPSAVDSTAVTPAADSGSVGLRPNVKSQAAVRGRDINRSANPSPMVEHVHTTDAVLQKKHNPKLAIGLSAILPGAGQIYNKKAWKIPIFYAGLGAAGTLIWYFGDKMVVYRNEYRNRMQGNTALLKPELATQDDGVVLNMKQKYTRYMEIAIAAGVAVYFLNIIDAAVDAHLFYFDISDDLSLQAAPYVQPTLWNNGVSYGATLTLRFK